MGRETRGAYRFARRQQRIRKRGTFRFLDDAGRQCQSVSRDSGMQRAANATVPYLYRAANVNRATNTARD